MIKIKSSTDKLNNEISPPVKVKPKIQSNAALEEKIYWIQIAISIGFGFFTYYTLDFGWISMGLLRDILLMLVLHLLLIVLIPFLLRFFRTEEGLRSSFKNSLKNIGTNLILFLIVCGVLYMVNI